MAFPSFEMENFYSHKIIMSLYSALNSRLSFAQRKAACFLQTLTEYVMSYYIVKVFP